jgi:hypothetical protein
MEWDGVDGGRQGFPFRTNVVQGSSWGMLFEALLGSTARRLGRKRPEDQNIGNMGRRRRGIMADRGKGKHRNGYLFVFLDLEYCLGVVGTAEVRMLVSLAEVILNSCVVYYDLCMMTTQHVSLVISSHPMGQFPIVGEHFSSRRHEHLTTILMMMGDSDGVLICVARFQIRVTISNFPFVLWYIRVEFTS